MRKFLCTLLALALLASGRTDACTNVIVTPGASADGSSTSTTISYDVSGNPTEKVNEDVDVDGNASTQSVAYDDDGEEVVTGYSIDTSGSETG